MPATDSPSTNDTAGTPAVVAGGVGAMAACCTVQLLIVAGVLAGLGGAAPGATTLPIWRTA